MKSPSDTPRRARRLVPVLAATAASLALAACASSSSSSSGTTSTSAAATGGSSANRTAFVQCLKKHGITPPQGAGNGGTRTRPPSGGAPGAGIASNPTLQAAFKACGANGQHRPGSTATTRTTTTG
jgi:hypothetical protein